MTTTPVEREVSWPKRYLLRATTRWVRGAVNIVGLLVIWFLLSSALPALGDGFADAKAVARFLLLLVFVPTLLGWISERFLNPLFLRWESGGGMVRWEDRVVEEFALDENRGFEVVLVPFPSAEVRTLGLVTSTFPDPNGNGELATVFLPKTPKPMSGSLRIVSASNLEPTDLKLAQLVHYHASYGSNSPSALTRTGAST
ncbi:MAG: DUF502 domain-containing protein [marine benthic group bacterium]|nr:DUF502 domain-containing protein [Gemmatimonadota bacterium]